MRYLFSAAVISMLVLGGCKPKDKSTTTTTGDTTKTSTKDLKMPDIGDVTSTTKTAGNWSKAYRSKFVSDCITKASESLNASQAFGYCDCMTDKVERKYPNESTVDKSLTSADIETMRAGCLPSDMNQSNTTTTTTQPNNNNQNQSNQNQASASWSSADQKEFMDNCVPKAAESMGQQRATQYCSCMMNKIMIEYPNSADASRMSQERMTELARQCLGM